jgi:two-component system, chemotaxis family, protein-glutamate methylesterase/glutaminase
MVAKVLVVDDSAFFRKRIVEILEADSHIEVVGTAADGREAIRQVSLLKPDVVTMDIEMPVMDGITAVRRIMAIRPTPVLMFSSLSYEGAQATLDALDAGALDFLPKRFDDITRDREQAKRILRARVRQLAAQKMVKPALAPRPVGTAAAPAPARGEGTGRLAQAQLVAIASSTGGPVALQQVLTALPKDFPLPILLVQHMPASFTPAFANRLDQQCAIRVKEAADGDVLHPGTAYLAPGGRQLTLQQRTGQVKVHIEDGDPGLHFKPCADVTFNSVAAVYGGKVQAVVLTGMGADGREGARALKKAGASVWAQDEATCVIYGMPQAVVEAGIADQVLPLPGIGPALARGK